MGTVSKGKRDICPRCLLKVALGAKSCPSCGMRLVATHRIPIYVGIVGVLMLIFVSLVMIMTIRREDAEARSSADVDDAPSTNSGPSKPPPLNK